MFEVRSIRAVKKDLKKLSPEIVRNIETVHFGNIRENPLDSDELGYAFKGMRSYHFNHKGTSESFTKSLKRMNLSSSS